MEQLILRKDEELEFVPLAHKHQVHAKPNHIMLLYISKDETLEKRRDKILDIVRYPMECAMVLSIFCICMLISGILMLVVGNGIEWMIAGIVLISLGALTMTFAFCLGYAFCCMRGERYRSRYYYYCYDIGDSCIKLVTADFSTDHIVNCRNFGHINQININQENDNDVIWTCRFGLSVNEFKSILKQRIEKIEQIGIDNMQKMYNQQYGIKNTNNGAQIDINNNGNNNDINNNEKLVSMIELELENNSKSRCNGNDDKDITDINKVANFLTYSKYIGLIRKAIVIAQRQTDINKNDNNQMIESLIEIINSTHLNIEQFGMIVQIYTAIEKSNDQTIAIDLIDTLATMNPTLLGKHTRVVQN